MKKNFCVVLALIVALGCVFGLTACGKDDSGEKKPEIPEGYKKYQNEAISFGYPEEWSTQEGSVTILSDASGEGNNITVVSGEDDGTYKDMTIEKFNTTVKPAYEVMGMSVSDVSLETVTVNGLSVLKIAYTVSAAEISLGQTQFIVSIEGKVHAITVTESTPDAKLVSTVLETLRLVK